MTIFEWIRMGENHRDWKHRVAAVILVGSILWEVGSCRDFCNNYVLGPPPGSKGFCLFHKWTPADLGCIPDSQHQAETPAPYHDPNPVVEVKVHYTYDFLPIPLDPKIDTNYTPHQLENGFPIVWTTEDYLGSTELRGPVLKSFVDLGADGIAIIDLMEYCPLDFVSPKACKDVKAGDDHFLLRREPGEQ